jgi:plasmid stabilization system protein ParE
MASKNVEFHEGAALDVDSALDWYLRRSDSAALRFSEEFDRAVGLISESPQRWPSGKHGTRKFPLRRFPFVILYREMLHVVQILAVAHFRRRPNFWKNRL